MKQWASSIYFNKHARGLCNLSELCLNSPPKPHAFVSLPLQSNLSLNLQNYLSKIFSITLALSLIMS